MVFWQRFLILLLAVMAVSLVAGTIWRSVFDFNLPAYVSGVIGGLTAVPLWDFLKRFKPKK